MSNNKTANGSIKVAHPNMTAYAAFKQVLAVAMPYGEACAEHGVRISKGVVRSDDDMGYLVQYPDGYISWCPKAQFAAANVANGDYSFAHALQLLAIGATQRIYSRSWNGSGQYVQLVEMTVVGSARLMLIPAMHVGGQCLGMWHPSPADLGKNDWIAE